MNPYKKNILFLVFTFFVLKNSAGQENSNFIQLNKEIGIAQNVVEDHLGYIWFAKNNGLYKYDGYDFTKTSYQSIFGKHFTNDKEIILSKDSKNNFWLASFRGELSKINKAGISISYKHKLKHDKTPLQITSIYPTKKNVWFGAKNGTLFKYNQDSSTIDSLTTLPRTNDILQHINSISTTDTNQLWISTKYGCVYKFDIDSGKLTNLLKIRPQNIRLVSDKKNWIWIATESNGLLRYDTKNNVFGENITLNPTKEKFKHPMFISLFCDSKGNIWGGTDGDGLYKVNTKNDKVTNFKHNNQNDYSLSSNTVTAINEDSHGNIWIATKSGNTNIIPSKNNTIKYYNGSEDNTPSRVLSVLKSKKDGSLWIGTDGKGIHRIFSNNSKKQYDNSKHGNQFFEGKYIHGFLEDNNGNIWIATYQRGLWIYKPKSKTFTKVKITDSEGKNNADIRYLFQDSKNRIWVTSDFAINLFTENQEKIAIYDYKSNGLFGGISLGIAEDENRVIWVSVTNGGLFKFQENTKDLRKSYFTNKNYFTKRKNEISNYNIQSINPDKNGYLWIVCTSGNILKFNLKKEASESMLEDKAIKNIGASALLFESQKKIWISTANGIHKYNLENHNLKSFYQIDGLQSNNFSKRSFFKDENGLFYFGGQKGLNSFYPHQMVKKETLAKLYINEIEILNKPAHLLIPDQLTARIENTEKILLNSSQSSFSFKFSAIDNTLNVNYKYAYRLKGFDKNWITAKTSRTASYTNIPSGNYIFEVKASSKIGQWDISPKSISVIIKAPWWYSSFAFIVYFILFLLLIYSITTWLHLKNRLAKEAWHNQKEKELYGLKMNFFAKMSHEIQTPLTLILGPIEDMLDRAGTNGNQLLKQRLTIINNNAKRLSRIATELMTVRNKELGKLRVFASKNDFKSHLKNIALSFTEQARFKNIDLLQEYPENELRIWYDRDKIEHVVYNLLSNALKFTPREGNVSIKVKNNLIEEAIEFSITDSGPGIPKEELEDIFKLFYQSDLGKNKKGLGVGLALSKELISLHNGSLDVTSSENGTTFTVKLSTKETLFSEKEKISIDSSKLIKQSLNHSIDDLRIDLNLKTKSNTHKKYTLLIVEDNVEMQIFLRDVLGKSYHVLIAENGKEGIEISKKNLPDLILSDIMMPVMNGIEMCSILQKNRKTSHIPIVLLTAKNTTKTKLKGLKSGAIEYIQKPFNFHELLLKVNNIIDTKEKVLAKYKTEIANSPKELVEKSKDDQFLEKLVLELNQQLDNSSFKLEDLAKTLNMSYSVIYRKCQDITGMTLVEFVRSIRLKKAALLIVKQGYNIAEAAFMVGYKDSKYFTKCFKEEFGNTPNNLKREAKKIGITELLEKYKLH